MYAFLNQDEESQLKNGTRVKDFVKKFSRVVESNDVHERLKAKYDLNDADDRIKFKKFMYHCVDSYEQQKFIKSKNCKLLITNLFTFRFNERSVDENIHGKHLKE